MDYLAKSNPKETIQEHTDELLKNYRLLKKIYPQIPINWELLKLAVIYHDFGKINKKFQKKLRKKPVGKEIPHGFLSIAFLNEDKLYDDYKLTEDEIEILVNAIAYHHERDFILREEKDFYKKEVEELKDYSKNFSYLGKNDYHKDLNTYISEYVNTSRIQKTREFNKDNSKNYYQYILVKGLLNKLDYAASAHKKVEIENNFLSQSMQDLLDNVWKKKDDKASFNKLQNYMLKNQNKNLIIIGETGLGKTEGALLWIGNSKAFFTLPLKAAINSIYDRIRKDIIKKDIEKSLGLLHGDAIGEYLVRADRKNDKLSINEEEIYSYNERTRLLSLPLTISTIDQLFDFVYKYGGFEIKLASLSYSKVVIDEIQMYSPDLIAYLISGLKELTDIGGKFAIITATFPPFIGDLLKEKKIEFEKPEAFLKENRIRHSIKINKTELRAEDIINKYKNNKILVIVNTIKKAQELYKDLNELSEADIRLFHSGFIKKDREKIEKDIIEFGKRDNKCKGIWIATQVAEASLDIDFDILITELSDINGLFQRMGRCYRGRQLDLDYNIYIHTEDVSGLAYVVDEDIFNYSKKEIEKLEGPLSEKKKIDIINKIYTKEMLQSTDYYKKILDTIEYIDGIKSYMIKKEDAKRYFRNIKSETVIPREVYEKNKDYIEKNIEVIKKSSIKHQQKEDRIRLRNDKIRSKNEINKFSIQVPYYKIKNKLEIIQINRYQYLKIFDCKYSKEKGIEYLKRSSEGKNDLFF